MESVDPSDCKTDHWKQRKFVIGGVNVQGSNALTRNIILNETLASI